MKNDNKNKPWSKKEDLHLNELNKKCNSINYISDRLGRTPGAIRSRIKLLHSGAAGSAPYAVKAKINLLNQKESSFKNDYSDLKTIISKATGSVVRPTKTQKTYFVPHRRKSYILSLFEKICNPLTDFDVWETLYNYEWLTFFKFPSNIDFNYVEKLKQEYMKDAFASDYDEDPDDYLFDDEFEMREVYEWDGTKKEFEEFMDHR